MSRLGPSLRELLQEPGIVVAMGAHDGLGARLAERAGFRALYHGSYAAASAHGLPDIGLIGLGETAANLRRVASSCALPVIADADTGYGDEVAVAQCLDGGFNLGLRCPDDLYHPAILAIRPVNR